MTARGGRAAAVVVAPALLAPAATAAAAAAGGPLLLPILATAAAWPAMAHLVLAGRRGAAVLSVLLWAASLSASVIVLTARDPAAAAPVVLRGEAYRAEMFEFVRTGSGRESTPALFLPQHALHLATFCVLAAATGGLLGLGLGAVLVGYMSFYVGALAAAGGDPAAAYLFGWPPWAILRVVAFVILGVLLSEPLLRAAARRAGWEAPPPARALPAAGAAATLLAADVLLKTLLARPWAALLRRCLPAP